MRFAPVVTILSGSWLSVISAMSGVVAAFAAAWAAGEARRSASAARDAVGLTRDSAIQNDRLIRSSHRSYVALERTTGTSKVSTTEIIALTFRFKNVGTTLAQEVHFSAFLGLMEQIPTIDELDRSLIDFHKIGTVAPSLVANVTADRGEEGGLVLTDTGLADIRAKRAYLVIAAKVTYKDIFGVAHKTTACMKADEETLSLHFTPFYNEMD